MPAPTHVVVFDIETGSRSEFRSIKEAAAFVGCDYNYMRKRLRDLLPFNGYTFASIENERSAKEKALSFRSRREYVPKRRKSIATSSKEKVPLRIDSRTVIYVTKDKANRKYAEQWIEQHEKSLKLH